MIIRSIRADEGAALRELRLEAVTKCPIAFTDNPAETMAMDWEKRARDCAAGATEAMFVAEVDGQLVGMTGAYRHPQAKTQHGCGIWTVYVKPEFRGRRIAEKLVLAAVDWAQKLDGVTIVRLMVTVGNDSAVACYRRCGFQISGTELAATRVDGIENDEYLMARRLKRT
jgi:ribosomal protein S18 acetylase RimI-like enzyme